MQTNFTPAQLADPNLAESNKILRACVHCGFCTATCPTYVLLGDELDSPRGRIYLIKDMLENDKPASAKVVTHIDRCLSCLSCMTTCPSGVHYMHLVDHARTHIEATYDRPLAERALRALLAWLLPHPGRFRLALRAARLVRPLVQPLVRLLARVSPGGRLGAMLALAPTRVPSPSPVDRPGLFPAEGPRRARVALLNGCAQRVLAPQINAATVRVLTRHGVEVVVAEGAGCCGALSHHLGKEAATLTPVKANIAAWTRKIEDGGLDAIVINASGCGTMVKDYGFLLRQDPRWAAPAAKIAALAQDVSEYLDRLDPMTPRRKTGLRLAYHAACSLHHGQKITRQPKALLAALGFVVEDLPEAHLCCGSAGTYNILQPRLAQRLLARKVANIETVAPEVIASGNIGCITQIAGATKIPIVHGIELIDWATGGPLPTALAGLSRFAE